MDSNVKNRLIKKVQNHFKNAKNCKSCIGSNFNMNDYDLENARVCSDNEYVMVVRKEGEEEAKFLYDIQNHFFAEIIDCN
ncbi:hypothetical protein C8C84_0049 [Flavobacterium sp. 102]|nr:hypothetical protein C8C84_0049 [Flavobacterium sp. 102]